MRTMVADGVATMAICPCLMSAASAVRSRSAGPGGGGSGGGGGGFTNGGRAIWGMDEGGEMRNMYEPTPQKGLWFTGHGFAQGRVWSRYVALQIKARMEGIETPVYGAVSNSG